MANTTAKMKNKIKNDFRIQLCPKSDKKNNLSKNWYLQ